MIVLISSMVGSGMVKVFLLRGFMLFNMSIGVTLMGGILSLSFCIESI